MFSVVTFVDEVPIRRAPPAMSSQRSVVATADAVESVIGTDLNFRRIFGSICTS
jgi:hypothetical protein